MSMSPTQMEGCLKGPQSDQRTSPNPLLLELPPTPYGPIPGHCPAFLLSPVPSIQPANISWVPTLSQTSARSTQVKEVDKAPAVAELSFPAGGQIINRAPDGGVVSSKGRKNRSPCRDRR